MRALRITLCFLLFGLSFPCWGCKENDPLESVIAKTQAAFTPDPDGASASADVVALRQGSADAETIILEVVLTEIDEPVTGVALKLTYPKTISKFISCSDGDLFPSGTCYYQEVSEGSGEVFIGRSVTGTPGMVVDGSRVAVRLEFLVFAKGSGGINFEGQNLGGSDASAVLDANGDPVFVDWFSGMLEGR